MTGKATEGVRINKNVLALAKGQERFVFLYDDESREALYEVLHRFAANPEINFNERDEDLLRSKAARL